MATINFTPKRAEAQSRNGHSWVTFTDASGSTLHLHCDSPAAAAAQVYAFEASRDVPVKVMAND